MAGSDERLGSRPERLVSADTIVFGPFRLDPDRGGLWRDDALVDLQPRPLAVLRYLAERQGHVVSRSELLSQIWSYADSPLTRSVDHAIARLRKKIEPDPRRPRFIHTVHGDGYCLTPEGRTLS